MTAGKMTFHPFAGACAFIISTAYVTRLPGQNPGKKHGDLQDSTSRSLLQNAILPAFWVAFRSHLQPCEAKMPDELENNLPLTAGGEVQPSTDFEGGECFVPIFPKAPVRSVPKAAPKPEPSPFARAFDTFYRNQGWGDPPPACTTPKTGISAPAADGGTGDTHA